MLFDSEQLIGTSPEPQSKSPLRYPRRSALRLGGGLAAGGGLLLMGQGGVLAHTASERPELRQAREALQDIQQILREADREAAKYGRNLDVQLKQSGGLGTIEHRLDTVAEVELGLNRAVNLSDFDKENKYNYQLESVYRIEGPWPGLLDNCRTPLVEQANLRAGEQADLVVTYDPRNYQIRYVRTDLTGEDLTRPEVTMFWSDRYFVSGVVGTRLEGRWSQTLRSSISKEPTQVYTGVQHYPWQRGHATTNC